MEKMEERERYRRRSGGERKKIKIKIERVGFVGFCVFYVLKGSIINLNNDKLIKL